MRGRWRCGAVGRPASPVSGYHVSVGLDKAERIPAGQAIAVLAQGISAEPQVGKRPVVEVRCQEVSTIWGKATSARVHAAAAAIESLALVPIGVVGVGLIRIALAECAVLLSIGLVAV